MASRNTHPFGKPAGLSPADLQASRQTSGLPHKSHFRKKVALFWPTKLYSGSQGWVSSSSSARTRRSMSSTMGLTVSTGCPAGSGRSQSR